VYPAHGLTCRAPQNPEPHFRNHQQASPTLTFTRNALHGTRIPTLHKPKVLACFPSAASLFPPERRSPCPLPQPHPSAPFPPPIYLPHPSTSPFPSLSFPKPGPPPHPHPHLHAKPHPPDKSPPLPFQQNPFKLNSHTPPPPPYLPPQSCPTHAPSPKTMPPPPSSSPPSLPPGYTHTTNPHGMTSTHWEFPKKTLLQKLGLKKVEDTGVVSKIECERKAGGCWGWGWGEERWGGGA